MREADVVEDCDVAGGVAQEEGEREVCGRGAGVVGSESRRANERKLRARACSAPEISMQNKAESIKQNAPTPQPVYALWSSGTTSPSRSAREKIGAMISTNVT